MRALFIALVLCCSSAIADPVPVKTVKERDVPVKIIGDETQLDKVKVEPKNFFDKPLIVTGCIKIDDNYIGGYENAKDSHYSLYLWQLLTPEKSGEGVWLYLRRDDVGKEIIDKIISMSHDDKYMHKTTPGLRIRAIIVLSSQRYHNSSYNKNWEFCELIDVQFPTPDAKDWEPLVRATHDKAVADADAREKATIFEAMKQAELVKKREAEKDLADEPVHGLIPKVSFQWSLSIVG